jgi:hypothetical protein
MSTTATPRIDDEDIKIRLDCTGRYRYPRKHSDHVGGQQETQSSVISVYLHVRHGHLGYRFPFGGHVVLLGVFPRKVGPFGGETSTGNYNAVSI